MVSGRDESRRTHGDLSIGFVHMHDQSIPVRSEGRQEDKRARVIVRHSAVRGCLFSVGEQG